METGQSEWDAGEALMKRQWVDLEPLSRTFSARAWTAPHFRLASRINYASFAPTGREAGRESATEQSAPCTAARWIHTCMTAKTRGVGHILDFVRYTRLDEGRWRKPWFSTESSQWLKQDKIAESTLKEEMTEETSTRSMRADPQQTDFMEPACTSGISKGIL